MTNYLSSKCDASLLCDIISTYCQRFYANGSICEMSAGDVYNAIISDNQARWISDLCADVKCAAEIMTIIIRTMKSPYYLLSSDFVHKKIVNAKYKELPD